MSTESFNPNAFLEVADPGCVVLAMILPPSETEASPSIGITINRIFGRGERGTLSNTLNDNHWMLLEQGSISLVDILIGEIDRNYRQARVTKSESTFALARSARMLLNERYDELLKNGKRHDQYICSLFRKTVGG